MRNRILVVTSLAMVMALPVMAHAQSANLVTLYSFSGGSDGWAPIQGLVFDTKGNLYGTTFRGGTINSTCRLGCGTVFQLAGAGGSWTLNTLHSFIAGPTDVWASYAHVTFDAAGHLYGTGGNGGANPCLDLLGCGGIFELLPSTGKEGLIYSFTQPSGVTPTAGLTLHKGSFYGTTQFGPETIQSPGNGTVFSLTPTEAGGKIQWNYRTILQFQFPYGSEPQTGDVVFDERGDAYIGVPYGGANQTGAIFEIAPTSGGTWKAGIIYSFPSTYGAGAFPSTLIVDKAGNLYGATAHGGQGCSVNGCGTVFELQRTATGWQATTLYEFASGNDGADPYAGLVFDTQGNLYGTTTYGGTGSCPIVQQGYSGCGTIFKLTNTNGTWQETTLYSFSGGSDGEYPSFGSLVLDSAGNLYGTTTGGAQYGTTGNGTVFELQP
jgi:hypothetical protein